MLAARLPTIGAPIACLLALAGCAASQVQQNEENKFYQDPQVRHCLDLEQDQQTSQARRCWSQLLRHFESDPAARERAELTPADMAKIRRKVGQAVDRSHALQRGLDRCFNISTAERDERQACLEAYLEQHGDRLTVAERFEVEAAIRSAERARARARGEVEQTIEHAGKLLGAELHLEPGGIRLDALHRGPLTQAGAPEQGIVVALAGTPVAELSAAERIARLESCQDAPLSMLVRHGGRRQVTFVQVRCRCGAAAGGEQIERRVLDPQICSQADSPELALGLSWCYLPAAGVLEVEQVCADSPAAAAGVRPGQRFYAIGDEPLLGWSPAQIAERLAGFPAEPLRLRSRDSLQTPEPLTGPPLPPERKARCWEAIRSSLQLEHEPDVP